MKENLKKCKILTIIVNVTFYIFIILIFLNLSERFFISMTENNYSNITLLYSLFSLIFLLTYFLIYLFSIIGHELFHVIFGLKANMKFLSFSILNILIKKENNKLKIKIQKRFPGANGYCLMTVENKVEYNPNKLKLYLMSGILFHIIITILSGIFIIINKNPNLEIILLLVFLTNLYAGIYNSIPFISKSGVHTDMLQLIYYSKDNNYLKSISNIIEVRNLLSNGTKLKDIKSNLFTMPNKINNKSDVINSLLYIDYILSKDDYKNGKKYITKILKEGKEILLHQEILLLKLNLIYCIFYDNFNIDEISDICDQDLIKYLKSMSKFSIEFIPYCYMYYTIIDKDEEKALDYLSQLAFMKNKIKDQEQIEDIEKFIIDIQKQIKE